MNTNRRIAKNTVMLYIRMLLVMGVSLYTSRIVLNTLGIVDFGVYSVVASFVTMFGFMNNAMTSATQRFLSFELGRNDKTGLRNVFSMSLNIHFGIALVVLLIAETLGLWFIETKLTIPPDRLVAAIWVFRFSVLTLIVNIISVPYNSMLIAYERMNAFAGISILEVCLKLLIVYILQLFGYDKLILYGILNFILAFAIRIFYGIYCKVHFKETEFKFYWSKELFRKISNHVGWMLFGTSAQMASDQGVNMLMNIFFGVTVNAARGIAYQVRGAVQSFVVNFMIAVRPQIIKSYAQGDFARVNSLVFTASKFSFFLLLYITLPILLLTDFILIWWLKVVPEYSVIFVRLVILDLFFVVLFTSLTTVSQASGKIKSYQLIVSGGFVLAFILSYVFFKLGFPSYYAFIITVSISLISLFVRLYILKIEIYFPMGEYISKVFIKAFSVLILSIPIPLVLMKIIEVEVLQFFIVSIASIVSTSITVYCVGITNSERKFIKDKSSTILRKIKG